MLVADRRDGNALHTQAGDGLQETLLQRRAVRLPHAKEYEWSWSHLYSCCGYVSRAVDKLFSLTASRPDCHERCCLQEAILQRRPVERGERETPRYEPERDDRLRAVRLPFREAWTSTRAARGGCAAALAPFPRLPTPNHTFSKNTFLQKCERSYQTRLPGKVLS